MLFVMPLSCLLIWKTFLSLSLVFMTLAFLKITGQLFCRHFFNWVYLLFLHYCIGLKLWYSYHKSDVMLLSLHFTRWHKISLCSTVVGINFDH